MTVGLHCLCAIILWDYHVKPVSWMDLNNETYFTRATGWADTTELMAARGSKLLGATGCAHLQTQAPATCLLPLFTSTPRPTSRIRPTAATTNLDFAHAAVKPQASYHTPSNCALVSKQYSLIMVIYFQNTVREIRSNPSLSSVWTFESLRGAGCDLESPSSHSWRSGPLLTIALGSQVVQPFSYCKLLWKLKKNKKKGKKKEICSGKLGWMFHRSFVFKHTETDLLLLPTSHRGTTTEKLRKYRGKQLGCEHVWPKAPKEQLLAKKKNIKRLIPIIYVLFFSPQTHKNKCPLFSMHFWKWWHR